MFRNFDNWDVYIDNDRKILAGCVQFMLKDGTTSANIYDSDKVPIENPQITDINGRTEEQVFIDDDIRAYVYKYVGTGTLVNERQLGIDTSDTSKWALQYTIESASIDERAVSGLSAMGVNTMDDLRALDPTEVPEIDGQKIITLNGYFEAGDKEPINYVWDPQSMLLDDNGSVIMSDNALTGRWILVQPTEHCDSRHFGVFPQDSVDSEEDHSVRMTQLISYCNTHSIRPYFNGSQSYPYFIYQNIAFQSRNAIDVSDDTVFVDKGTGNRFFGEWNGNPYFYNANTTVNSKTVRHSWHFKNYSTGTVKYIVDSTWSPVMLSNIDVEFEISPASSTQLTDCELSSNEKITDTIVLTGMTIHTDWFADDYDWSKLLMVNCKVILQNCKDANTYVLLKNKLHEANYGDLGEQTLSNTTLLANCIAENASFSNVTLTGDTELHNVSGTITISGAAYQLNFIDCWLTISNTDTVVMSTVMWRRGSVVKSVGNFQILSTLYLDNVDVNTTFYTPGVNPIYMNSQINVTQTNFRQCEYTNCVFNANIDFYPEYHTYHYTQPLNPGVHEATYQWYAGKFFKNVFRGDYAILMRPVEGVDYSDQTIGLGSKWCSNYSDHNFVDDSLWNGVQRQSYTSQWEYHDNYGGCLEEGTSFILGPVSAPYNFTYSYLGVSSSSSSNEYTTDVPDTVKNNAGLWIVSDGRKNKYHDTGSHALPAEMYWVLNLKDKYIPASNIFWLKNIQTSQSVALDLVVKSFIRADDKLMEMDFVPWSHGAALRRDNPTQLSVDVTSGTPMYFEYMGNKQFDDNTDEHRSILWITAYDCRNDATRFTAYVYADAKLQFTRSVTFIDL